MTTKRQLQATFWSTLLFCESSGFSELQLSTAVYPPGFVCSHFGWGKSHKLKQIVTSLDQSGEQTIQRSTQQRTDGAEKSQTAHKNGTLQQCIHRSPQKNVKFQLFLYFLCTYSISVYPTLCIIQNNKNIMCKITGNATQCKGSKMPKA